MKTLFVKTKGRSALGKRTNAKIPLDNWAASLGRALAAAQVKRPAGKGWKKVSEIAAERGISTQSTFLQVERWLRAGLVEVQHGRDEGNRPVRYFRPVKK